MRITSYGAAEEVTGSKHLVEANGHQLLLDCGMFQGRRDQSAKRNRNLPFDPGRLRAVVLSHAHIDHSGILPLLAQHGFKGQVFATPATRDLCAVMLRDSANIQERDAQWLSRKKQTFVPPLYGDSEVREIMRRFVSVPYDLPMEVAPGVRMTLRDAGHVLGSAMVLLEAEEKGKPRRLLYTGDLGRRDMPILNDPWIPEDADAVVMESTYGSRDHEPIEALDERLAGVINRTFERGGKIIVPSFALERSQEFVYALKRLEMAKAIPRIPVYVDSPLTVNITEVFRLHTDSLDEKFQKLDDEAGDPFQLGKIEYIRAAHRSKQLNRLQEPAIIISASGMCEFGRILHHLRNNCRDERNTILIIGFQAQHTLGRRIVEREPEIKIFGVKHELNAEVQVLNALSAHAGRGELVEFGQRFAGRARKVLLVHGEPPSQKALAQQLHEAGCQSVSIQKEGVAVEV